MISRRNFLQVLSATFASLWARLSDAQYIPQGFWRKRPSAGPPVTSYRLWAWGKGSSGALGNGLTTNRSSPIQIGSSTTWTAISAGAYKARAIDSNGRLWAWGLGQYGTIGNETTNTYSSPIQIGTLTTWSKIGGGDTTVFAIKKDGTFWSWGRNDNGQIGDNSIIDVSSPVQIGTLNTWSQVFPSYGGLAIKTDGTLWAWGDNFSGQLGDNSTINRSSPIQVGSLTGWSKAATGTVTSSYSTLALRSGLLWTWGKNASGLLGIGTTIGAAARSSPVQIGTLTNWSDCAINAYHALAVQSDGTLWSWGAAISGALGVSHSMFYPTGKGGTWTKVAAATNRTFAISSDSSIWCVGVGNNGQLGNGQASNYSSPIKMSSLSVWQDVSFFDDEWGMATRTDGTLWTWGDGSYGTRADGGTSSAGQVGSDTDWAKISAGYAQALAIRNNGTLWAWGGAPLSTSDLRKSVLLANGAFNVENTGDFIQYDNGTDWANAQLSFYEDHIIIKKADGTLWAWGKNSAPLGNGPGLLGISTTTQGRSSPVQIGTLTTWSKISVGLSHSFAIRSDNTLWAWGIGDSYRLGDQGTTDRNSPVIIGTNTDWVGAVAGGIGSGTAVRSDGTLWSWGLGTSGNLGNGLTATQTSPIQIGTGSDWTNKLAANDYNRYAIKTDGTLWAWGAGARLGNGTTIGASSPVQIGTLTTWSKVSANVSTALALRTDGTLWSWGLGTSGRNGDSTNTSRSSPVQIGTLNSWVKISAGGAGSAAIRSDGTLWVWGDNEYFHLGIDPHVIYVNSPVQIGSRTDWDEVVMGLYTTFATRTNGTLWVAGSSYRDQLTWRNGGTGNTSYVGIYCNSPQQLGTLTNWTSISAGTSGSFALRDDGTLWVWGQNTNGYLGLGTTTTVISPTQLGNLTTWSKVSAGISCVIATHTNGTLWGWGVNTSGQLGIGNTLNRSSPVQIGTLSDWSIPAAGKYSSYAIKTNGTLWGTGTPVLGYSFATTNVSSPVQLGSATNWSHVDRAIDHVIALKSDGTMWSPMNYANTNNIYGQLMNGMSGFYEASPVQVGTLTTWSKVYVSYDSSTAIRTDGTLWAWGQNSSGLLGNNSTLATDSPVQIGTATTWHSVLPTFGDSTIALKT